MIESALVTRTATEPTSPLVVSVPHAGVRTAGFERDAEPRARRPLRRRPVRRSPVPHRRARRARGLRGGAGLALRLRPEPRSRRRQRGRGAEHPAPRNADGRGSSGRSPPPGSPTLSRPLAFDEWRERTAIHAAYHDDRARPGAGARRFGYAILLDGHSMPSRGRTGHKDPGRARADVVPRRSRRHQLRAGADGAT